MINDDALEIWFCHEILPLERSLTQYIRRNSRIGQDVIDLRHDIYERAIKGARHGMPENSRGYLFAIARNHLINCARRSNVIRLDQIADMEPPDNFDDKHYTERQLEARSTLRLLQQGLEKLSPRIREIIWLRKVEGLNVQETSDRLGISKDAVNHQVMMGMRALADHMLGGKGLVVRPKLMCRSRSKKP